MSGLGKATSRLMGIPLIDPEVFAVWQRVAVAASRLRRVRLLTARQAIYREVIEGHVHAVPTVVCALAGTTRVECADNRVDVQPGEAALIAPGAWHRHAPLRTGSMVYAHGLMARRADVMLLSGSRRWWVTIPEQPSHRLLHAALTATSDLERVRLLKELIGGFAGEPAMALTMSDPQMAMARYLWGGFTRSITAADILRASGRSRAQAHLTFTRCFGEAPKRALTRSRLLLAAQLEAEGFPFAVVAKRSGFVSAARWRRARRGWRPLQGEDRPGD